MAEKWNLDEIDMILDETLAKFPSGAAAYQAGKGVPLKMVTTDIEFLFDSRGANTGTIVCGIATVDGVYYAALCDARHNTPQGYVEEVLLSPGGSTIKTVKLISNPEEWIVIVNFFQKNNVWELHRIFNWIWSVKNGTIAPSNKWVKELNSKMIKAGIKPISKKELKKRSDKLIGR